MASQREGGIAWTDQTWNPVRGCSRVSEGCRNCYAERVAARFSGTGKPYEGLAIMQESGPKWTGKVRMVEEHLQDPRRWRKPQKVFVNSMSDLFHEGLKDEEIDRVFDVMEVACRREWRPEGHTFQVLTKRAARMHEYVTRRLAKKQSYADGFKNCPTPEMRESPAAVMARDDARCVPPSIWLGVSVENQETADERIPELLRMPAAVRFLSVEPQIGPVDLRRWIFDRRAAVSHLVNGPACFNSDQADYSVPEIGIHWVIVGGESGSGARPFDLAWARSIVEQCRAAGVACFMKQIGSRTIDSDYRYGVFSKEDKRSLAIARATRGDDHVCFNLVLHRDRSGGDMAEWPRDLRVQQFPEAR